MHRVTPDQTSAHPDRPINLQIEPITAARSFHQRSNGSQASAAPVYRARVHTVVKPRASLSSRRRLSLSLLPTPISGRLKPPNHHIKVSNLLKSKTPTFFIVFSASSGRKKTAIVADHRSFKSYILPHQPSTVIKTTTIRILDLRSTKIDHRLARNLAEKFHCRQQ